MLAMFYYFLNLAYTKLRNHFMSSISLKYNDETFKWVLKYLHDEEILQEKTKLKCGIKKEDREWWQVIFQTKDDKEKPQVEYQPGPGMHLFTYKGRSFWMHHEEEKARTQGWESEIVVPATIYL